MNKKNTSPANKLKQYFMANNEWNASEIMLRIEQLIDDEKSAVINSFDMGNEINTYSNGEQYYKEKYEN